MFSPAEYSRRHMVCTCMSQSGFPPSRFEKLCDRLPGDVFLQNVLLRGIHRQKPGYGDAGLPRCFIVTQLRTQFVAECVVFARLMVDLFLKMLHRSTCLQIGIAAFSFPKELKHGIFRIVYRQCIRHRSTGVPYSQSPCSHGEQELFVPVPRHSGKSSQLELGQCRS